MANAAALGDEMYGPLENTRRARAAVLAALAGQPITFSDERSHLVAVFDDPVRPFDAGRVQLFQQFFLDRTGVLPEIVGEVSMCLKVFFSFGEPSDEERQLLRTLVSSAAFEELCRSLRVPQVQVLGNLRMIPPAQPAASPA